MWKTDLIEKFLVDYSLYINILLLICTVLSNFHISQYVFIYSGQKLKTISLILLLYISTLFSNVIQFQ